MNEKEFKRLLTLYLDGELSTEELVKLKEAVEETPSYRHLFQDEIRLHTLMREVVSEKIEEKKISVKNTRKPVKVLRPKPILPYIFAAVAAIVICGLCIGYYITQNKLKPVGVCVETPDEGIHEVIRGGRAFSLHKDMELFKGDTVVSDSSGGSLLMLNDGSMVSLDKNTGLELLDSKDAQVSLSKGKILLEVNKRQPGESPFLVKTSDSVMTVLGTIFSVDAEQDGFTKLSVFEGKVELERQQDTKKVQVGANEFVLTSDRQLKAAPLIQEKQKATETVSILPEQDVYIEGKKVNNENLLKVRKNERTIYLKFNVEKIGAVQKAVLKLTQDIDPGSGTLFFHLGDHSDWTEKSIRSNNAPRPQKLIAKRTGVVAGGRQIEIDLSKSINSNGIYTIIITLSKGDSHDIWFSSREGANPPLLELIR